MQPSRKAKVNLVSADVRVSFSFFFGLFLDADTNNLKSQAPDPSRQVLCDNRDRSTQLRSTSKAYHRVCENCITQKIKIKKSKSKSSRVATCDRGISTTCVGHHHLTLILSSRPIVALYTHRPCPKSQERKTVDKCSPLLLCSWMLTPI